MEPRAELFFKEELVIRARLTRLGAGAAAVLVFLASIPAGAQGRTADLDEYISLLEVASAAAPEGSPALRDLNAITTVRVPDGTTLQVSADWPAPGNASLKPRLDTTLAEVRAWRVSAPQASQDPRAVAREITDGSEFDQKKSLVSRIKDAIDDFFKSFRSEEIAPPDIDLPKPPDSKIPSLVSQLVLIAAISLVIYFIWRRLRAINRAEDEDEGEPEEIWDIGPADPVKLNEMASTAAAEGRYSDAVRAFYVANLLRLDSKGVIRFRASDTNGTFRRSLLSSFGPVVREFDVATFIFERVHYGEHTATADDWERTKAAWQGVFSGVAA